MQMVNLSMVSYPTEFHASIFDKIIWQRCSACGYFSVQDCFISYFISKRKKVSDSGVCHDFWNIFVIHPQNPFQVPDEDVTVVHHVLSHQSLT